MNICLDFAMCHLLWLLCVLKGFSFLFFSFFFLKLRQLSRLFNPAHLMIISLSAKLNTKQQLQGWGYWRDFLKSCIPISHNFNTAKLKFKKCFYLVTVAVFVLCPHSIIFERWCSASFTGIDMDGNHRGQDRITWHKDFISLFILR